MNTTSEVAIAKLQSNPAKNNTRTMIASQAVEWTDKGNIKEINSATLPADGWLFENTFQTLSDMQSVNKPSINFYCAESKPKVFNRSLNKMLPNGNLYKGNFENMVKGQVEWKSGLGYHSESILPQPFNFIWADYCKNADIEDTKEFARMTASMPNNSIAYITYSVMCRRKGGQKKLAKTFKGYTNGSEDIHKAVKGATTFLVKAYNRNRKVQPILNVIYGGGSRGGSTMLVLGYAIGMKHNLTAIEKNLRDNKTTRNYTILNRIRSGQIVSTHKGFISKVRKNKKAYKGVYISTAKKLEIAKLIRKGWNSYEIVNHLKVAMGTVRGMRAHIENPNSFKR